MRLGWGWFRGWEGHPMQITHQYTHLKGINEVQLNRIALSPKSLIQYIKGIMIVIVESHRQKMNPNWVLGGEECWEEQNHAQPCEPASKSRSIYLVASTTAAEFGLSFRKPPFRRAACLSS